MSNQQTTLDFDGWHQATAGMMAALDNANKQSEDWGSKAAAMFAEYCNLFGHEPFMTEDVRDWSEANGLPLPPDKRAWGAIAASARKSGKIRSLGYAPQKSANAHRAPKTLWVRA